MSLYHVLQFGKVRERHRTLAKEWVTSDSIDLTEVKYLRVVWNNDKMKKNCLKKTETIDLDDLECDNINSTTETTVTLDRCIQMFSEEEILEKSEFWYCSTCKVYFCTSILYLYII